MELSNPNLKRFSKNQSSFDHDNVTTVKVISKDYVLAAKLSADIRSRFKVFSGSKLMINPKDRVYYVFLNIRNSDLAEALQEVSPFPKGA